VTTKTAKPREVRKEKQLHSFKKEKVSTWGWRLGISWFKTSLDKKVSETPFQ
jgi:hypothetical protein